MRFITVTAMLMLISLLAAMPAGAVVNMSP